MTLALVFKIYIQISQLIERQGFGEIINFCRSDFLTIDEQIKSMLWRFASLSSVFGRGIFDFFELFHTTIVSSTTQNRRV